MNAGVTIRRVNASVRSIGGGVTVHNNGTFTMNDGAIYENEARLWGGGVTVETNGTFTMNGGIITNNRTLNGGGVSVVNATFNMNGGTISGNIATDGGGVSVANNGRFNMSGNSIIRDNKASNQGGGIYVTGNSVLTMNESAVIIHNTAGTNGGGVHINGTLNMNGGTISGNRATNGGGVHTWGANTTFNMRNNALIQENQTTSITPIHNGGGGGVRVDGGTFTMTGGNIRRNTSPGTNITSGGGGVRVANGTFNMNGGNIYNNNANSGSGVYVQSGAFHMRNTATIHNNNGNGVHVAGGTFTMHDGVIRHHSTTTNGGGVRVTGGTFNMINGEIHNNNAPNGGGVHISELISRFEMTGGNIHTNTATTNGGGIYHDDGLVNIESGSIRDNTAPNGSGGGIYSHHRSISYQFTTGAPVHFQRNSASFSTTFRGEGYSHIGFASKSITGRHVLNNFDINYGERPTCNPTNWYELVDASNEPSCNRIVVMNDITIQQEITLPDYREVTITSNDTSNPASLIVNADHRHFIVQVGSQLTLEHIILQGRNSQIGGTLSGGGVLVEGTFTMNIGVTIRNNHRSAAGAAGVYVSGISARFYMNAGIIEGNKTTGISQGGAVRVAGGIFNMNGGNIRENTATIDGGGGVRVVSGTFNMTDGNIYNNNAPFGGGVHVINGTFTMTGGNIRGNTSSGTTTTSGGGGVRVTGGTFNMINGEIEDNSASRGGGVLVTGDNAVFTMNGGAIDANTAASYGGGIYHASGTVNIQNGSIRNNEASESGGGIYSYHFSALTTSNQVQFQGNSARFSTTFRGNPEDYPTIRFASTSFGNHVLNNYDINYGTETGELMFWDVPEVVSFEGVKLSDTTSIVNRANDWELIVHDGRGSGSTWQMTVTLTEQFINEAGQPLRGDLMYGDQIMKENLAIPVFDYTTTTETEIPVRWSEDEGIRMLVNPSSFIGHYTGTLMWTLVDAP